MPTLDLAITANADDGWTDTVSYNNPATRVFVGQINGNPSGAFLRFVNVTIPPGAVINSAVLTVVSTGKNSTLSNLRTKVRAEDADNPSAVTDIADFSARTRTTAGVDWDPSVWTTGTAYDSPDLTAVIQEVIDRAGWASGNAIQLLWDDDGSLITNVYVASATLDNTTDAEPLLVINYSVLISTSASATATAYSNQRKIDRCQNGVLWSAFSSQPKSNAASATNVAFSYSTDDGATWTAGGALFSASASGNYEPNMSLFIDLDDYAHLVYKDRLDGKVYYRRGTPNTGRTAWTWSAAFHVAYGTADDYPDVIAHREGTGWTAHIVFSEVSIAPNNFAIHRQVDITSGGTITVGTATTLSSAYGGIGVHTWPSIDFNHTGDGKTVAGSTPHLYAAWSAGTTGAGKGIRFKKATYSGGSWTWGTEREIDSTRYLNNQYRWINCLFDGTRVVIAGMVFTGSANDLMLYQRDAADTSTTVTTLITPTTLFYSGSCSYDASGNLYLLGADGSSPYSLIVRKWNRSTTTLESATEIDPGLGSFDRWTSTKRGYSNGRIEYSYTDGTASPYNVTYGQIILNSIITDPVFSDADTLYTDGLARILSDPALSDADTFYVDVLLQQLVISDPALTDGDTLYVDVLDATRYITDPALTGVSTFFVDGMDREVNISPYWRWRFVRQNGHLFIIPAKNAQGWAGADVVSSDFRYNSDLMPYVMDALVTAWGTHSGSATATLKAAVDTALGAAGIRDMQGNVLT